MIPATDLMPEVPPVVPLKQQANQLVHSVTEYARTTPSRVTSWYHNMRNVNLPRVETMATALVLQLRETLRHAVTDPVPQSHSALRYGIAHAGAVPETRAMLASDEHYEGHRPIRVAVLSAATTVGLSLLGTFGTPAVTVAAPADDMSATTKLAAVTYKPMHLEVLSAATTLRLQSHTATHAIQEFPSLGGVSVATLPSTPSSRSTYEQARLSSPLLGVDAKRTGWSAIVSPTNDSEVAAA